MTADLGRFTPPEIDASAVERMSELCDYIEDGRSVDAVSEMLAEWNGYAHRDYEKHEFESYYQSMDKSEFVTDALMPAGERIDDLKFSEFVAAMDAVTTGVLDEARLGFVMRMLDANLPGSQLSDLIYWPEEWFSDPAAKDLELTTEQLVVYAAARAQRALPDAPPVELPLPVPTRG
ncbi:MAG: hypothetical protein AAF654_04340 [Myxococcota bacterium]